MSNSPDRYAAFLSYAHRYEPWVRILQSNLEKCLAAVGRPGKVFLDQTDLGSGRSWVTQLQAGIDRSDHVILIATPEALASPRVGDEWGSFLAARPGWLGEGRLHIVLLVAAPIPPVLSQIQNVDFRGESDARYREALRKLTAGVLGYSDRRQLPELAADIEIPKAPHPGLDPPLRARLIGWLNPIMDSKAYRRAIAPALQLRPEQLDGYPSLECASSALLVLATADDEPFAAAVRIVDTLRETLEDDEPDRIVDLVPLRKDLLAKQRESPERSLLATWMDQVVKDHERLVPYFQQQAEINLLDRVYVKLEVRPEVRSLFGESEDALHTARSGSPLGLREILSLSREENPWISGRWVVLGDPGSGKTTLLRHLVATLARQSDRRWVPLFESLPKFLREREWLLDRVVRRLERAGHPAQGLAAALDREGKDGHLLLLLDGLDEVPSDDRGDVEKLLRDLATRWPTTPIVVASRPIGYYPLGGDFRELRLLPLDHERRQEFLARWLGRAADRPDEVRAKAALTALDGPELRDLAGNPLYLTLMALLFEQGREPARHRTQLYDQVFDLLLEGKHRPEGRPMEAKEAVRDLLRHLALGMTEDNLDAEALSKVEDRLYRPEVDAARSRLERVGRWHGRMRQFLEDLAGQTGIIGPHDGEDADWRFWHRTFREALAAEYLEGMYRAKDGKAAVLARAGQITTEEDLSAWAEPFALLAGRLEAPDELVKDLVKKNRALGLRSVATAQRLRVETLQGILELSENWKDRKRVFALIPELVVEPRRALAVLDQLRKGTTNGNDLFFLDRTVREVSHRWPNLAGEAEDLIHRFYDHIPAPDEDHFIRFEPSRDRGKPLWCEIPAGAAWIGSPEDEGFGDEKPKHRVTISRSFAMMASVVTNQQFSAFDKLRGQIAWKGVPESELLFHPAVGLTWFEAVSFSRWLASSFLWARGVRLPIEEEWEYACRASSETRYWSGNTEKDLSRVGWHDRNSGGRTHRVGEKEANRWGLYDVHGNVSEWTLSLWTDRYEGDEDGKSFDPCAVDVNAVASEAAAGGGLVARGGGKWMGSFGVRSAYRLQCEPELGDRYRGFRLLLPGIPELLSQRRENKQPG